MQPCHDSSVMHVLHSSEFAMWSAAEHLDRARHLQSTFDKNYSRGVVNSEQGEDCIPQAYSQESFNSRRSTDFVIK